MKSALIVGTGLIGASMGLGLRDQGWTVIGWDPDDDALRTATEMGAIDASVVDLDLAGHDLVVLAGPHDAVVHTLQTSRTDGLIIDVAGVKHEIVNAGAALNRFVGTHPMAGREHTGAAFASAGLFKGATWIVVTDQAESDDLAEVDAVVSSLGAIPRHMTAAEHDAAVSLVSAVPHVIAAALLGLTVDDETSLSLAAGSFRDLTRVSLSDPAQWADLFVANRSEVSATLHHLSEKLGDWASLITAGDPEPLEARLSEAREVRQSLAPPVAVVRVYLEDRPGELAGVGRALNVAQVDVRDLQLRHGEHGGGGVLRLSVRPGEAETLLAALRTEGFQVE